MSIVKLPTQFAPAERAPSERIEEQSRHFVNEPLMQQMVNAIPEIVLVLNKDRQVIFANNRLLELLGVDDASSIYGSRPGEILDCIHATEALDGCGTTEFCSTCGAVNAILTSQKGIKNVRECRIIQKVSGNALDLRVTAAPVTIGDELFTVFSVVDVADEKRRHALERIFFHDILNTAGSLRGFAEIMTDADEDELDELGETVYRISEKLIQEIVAQRQLISAENSELKAKPVELQSLEVLKAVDEIYQAHNVSSRRILEIAGDAESVAFTSDETIVLRVIGNMVKNALEAARDGDTVTSGCSSDGKVVEFWVTNPTFMPREVQLQVFQHSFSTKGEGRGLGTYSMKLLSERYLKDKVSFTTSESAGTTFRQYTR